MTEDVNGWLFPDGDINALAAKILVAVNARDALPGIGQAARRTAEEKADWKMNFQKLLETYQKVIAEKDRS